MNIANVYKYAALPTWLLIQVLVSNMVEHPYRKEYPNLLSWALYSNGIFRFFDLAFWLLLLALTVRTAALFL